MRARWVALVAVMAAQQGVARAQSQAPELAADAPPAPSADSAPAAEGPAATADTAPAPAEDSAAAAAAPAATPDSAPSPSADSAPPAAAAPAATAAGPESASTPAVVPPAPATPPPPPSACQPLCADGYVCQSGRCVSTCYPPCGFGQRCHNGGCVGARSAHADGTPRWNWDASPPPVGEGAPVPGQPSGYHRHDGFLLRGTLRVAGGGAFYDAPGGERELGGGGLGVGIDLGWALDEHVALFARLASHGFSDEATTEDDADAPAPPAEDPSIRFEGGLLAAGLSYYLMPYNIYLGGTVGMMGADVDNVDADGIQDVPMRAEGYVIQLEGAKEWWLSANWAMGVGAQLSFGGARVREIAPDDEAALEAIEDAGGLYEAQLRHFSLGLLGSVTYH